MKHPFRSAVAAVSSMVMLTSLAACGGSDTAQSDEKELTILGITPLAVVTRGSVPSSCTRRKIQMSRSMKSTLHSRRCRRMHR